MYYVDYQTGVTSDYINNLEAAQIEADKNAAYTGQDIIIYNTDNQPVTCRKWYGYNVDDENIF